MKVIGIEEAAALLPRVGRVMVFGCSGSGKSTLSQKLASRFGLRYLSMDKEFFWLPGWKMRDRVEIVGMMRESVKAERWLIDGTSPGTMPIRLPRAEFAIWMRLPRLLSVWGILSRWTRLRGQTRPEMAEGCPEKMDIEFLSYVWNFEKIEAPQIEEVFALHGQHVPVLMLKSHRETARLLALLDERS